MNVVVESLRLELDRIAVSTGRRHATELVQRYTDPPGDIVLASIMAFEHAAERALIDAAVVSPAELPAMLDRLRKIYLTEFDTVLRRWALPKGAKHS